VDPVTGLPLALTDATWNANNAAFTGGNLKPVDPRLDWTVGRDDVPYKDWGPQRGGGSTTDWIRARSYGGPYSPKKNAHEHTSGAQSKVGWQPEQLNSVKIHIFRYADMLLLLAEADVEATTPDLVEANTIVNEIRARAGQTAQGVGCAPYPTFYPDCTADRASIAAPMIQTATVDSLRTAWARYKIGLYPAFPDQATARTAVRYERRLELALEGQRFFDLRRWGIDQSVIPAYMTVETTRRGYKTGAAAFAPKHHLYPIPDIQLELSKVGAQSALCQNPGWGGTTCP
jgi:hypothetical protein